MQRRIRYSITSVQSQSIGDLLIVDLPPMSFNPEDDPHQIMEVASEARDLISKIYELFSSFTEHQEEKKEEVGDYVCYDIEFMDGIMTAGVMRSVVRRDFQERFPERISIQLSSFYLSWSNSTGNIAEALDEIGPYEGLVSNRISYTCLGSLSDGPKSVIVQGGVLLGGIGTEHLTKEEGDLLCEYLVRRR